MTKKRKAVVDKWKKKKTFSLIGPKIVGNVELGETVADKPEKIINRTIIKNMSQVTNNVKKRNVELTFKVREVKGSNAFTDLVKYELKKSFLRRLFRRKSSKIETNQYLTSKDGHKIKIKAVLVTMRKVETDKKTDIRKIMTDQIKKIVEENPAEKVFSIMFNKNLLYEGLSKIKKIAVFKKAEVELIKLIK